MAAGPRESSLRVRLDELVAYRELLQTLVVRDLKARYRGSVLGFLWTFANPILMLLVYSLVFGIIARGNAIHDYGLFLFTGLVPWYMVSSAVLGGTICLLNNASLIRKVYFPSELIPMATVLASLVNYLLTMIIVIPLLLIFGFHVVSAYLPVVVFLLLLLLVFCLGCALLLSVATVFFRDFEQLANVGLMAWFFLTPIVYSTTLFAHLQARHPALAWLPYLNPMTGWMVVYRHILLYGSLPGNQPGVSWAMWGLLYMAGWSVLLLVVGYSVFIHFKRRLDDEL